MVLQEEELENQISTTFNQLLLSNLKIISGDDEQIRVYSTQKTFLVKIICEFLQGPVLKLYRVNQTEPNRPCDIDYFTLLI